MGVTKKEKKVFGEMKSTEYQGKWKLRSEKEMQCDEDDEASNGYNLCIVKMFHEAFHPYFS